MYWPNSTRLGSTITIFTSSGLVLTKREVTIEFIDEDLPAPVWPAIKTCGSSDKFKNLGLPDISNPNPTFKGWLSADASLDERTSPRDTSFLCLFGISIPMALLPGIGANNLTSGVARAYAMSWDSDVTFDTFTPGANSISYLVTVGPGTTFVNSASTPCSFSNCVKSLAVSCNSFLEVDTEEPLFNNLTGGSLYSVLLFTLFLTFLGLVVIFFSLKLDISETLDAFCLILLVDNFADFSSDSSLSFSL